MASTLKPSGFRIGDGKELDLEIAPGNLDSGPSLPLLLFSVWVSEGAWLPPGETPHVRIQLLLLGLFVY